MVKGTACVCDRAAVVRINVSSWEANTAASGSFCWIPLAPTHGGVFKLEIC